jgi:adenine-specific DNA-methyltransferase
MNDFFVLRKSDARRLRLSRYTKRLITRSAQLKGIALQSADWQAALDFDFPVLLLDLPRKAKRGLGAAARRYVRYGEKRKFHKGYKCSIRSPWHAVPSVWVPDAFLLRQIHGYPKLIINRADATCTDTIHRLRFKDPREGEQITTAFLNSLTFAFAEIIGRSYGGGVLELEPNEADALPIPLAGAEALDLKDADGSLRGDRDLSGLLDKHDAILLIEGLGISKADTTVLRDIWVKLRDRRIGRKVTPA